MLLFWSNVYHDLSLEQKLAEVWREWMEMDIVDDYYLNDILPMHRACVVGSIIYLALKREREVLP